MKKFFLLLSLCLFCFSSNSFAHEGVHEHEDEASEQLKVLIFSGTGWYRHPETPRINGWLVRFGMEHDIIFDVTENGKDLMRKNLDTYDVLLFNNSNELAQILDGKQRASVEEWYGAGGGIFGLHALLVHQQEWEWLNDLGGCDFNSDSLFLEARVVVDPAAIDHPAVAGWGSDFMYTADWTNHTNSVTGLPGVQVLLRVDESTYEPVRPLFIERGGKAMGEDHPIAWTRLYKGGRFFYTELGHDVRSLDTKFGRQHLLEGILWAADRK